MARVSKPVQPQERGGKKSRTQVRGGTTGPRLVPVWNILFPGGDRFGEDRIRLLRAIRDTGSLLQAATVCDLSYRTAWNRVKEMNAATSKPLVESVQGGADGGASRLSAQAVQLLGLHEQAERLFRVAEAGAGLDPTVTGTLSGFRRRLSMRTSIRNQLPCLVRAVETDGVASDIELELEGGASILARVTAASCVELGLARGREAWVLVKAGKVVAGRQTPKQGGKLSNVLAGTVMSVRRGAGTDEVVVRIEGGVDIVANALETKGPELEVGEKVMLSFDGKDVIIAVG